MVGFCPAISGSDLSAREDHRVKDGVVFSDEVIQLHVVGISPPELPLIGVTGSY
jgi:hypothetical protein